MFQMSRLPDTNRKLTLYDLILLNGCSSLSNPLNKVTKGAHQRNVAVKFAAFAEILSLRQIFSLLTLKKKKKRKNKIKLKIRENMHRKNIVRRLQFSQSEHLLCINFLEGVNDLGRCRGMTAISMHYKLLL